MHSHPASHSKRDRYLLIVDDEPGVLEVARIMAASLGWSPLLANSAEHARALFRDHADVLGHVLVDLHLPGGDGLALARTFRALRPDVHVAVMTGDDDATRKPLGESGLVNAILVKPFTLDDLDHVFDADARTRAA